MKNMKTQRIRRKNIHSFCRTCLAEIAKNSIAKGQKYNVHQTHDLSKWILVCTTLEIDKNDGYPKFLCKQCFEKCQSLYAFREMCIKSMQELKNVVDDVDNGTESKVQAIVLNKKKICDEVLCKTELNGTEVEEKNNVHKINETEDKSLVASVLENNDFYEEKNESKEPDILKTIRYSNCNESFGSCSDNSILENFEVLETANCLDHSIEFSSENIMGEDTLTKISPIQSDDTLQDNLQEEIPTDNTTKNQRRTEAKFQCEYCSRRCISEQNLEAHLRIHQGLKPFQCNQCDRAYNKASHLKMHIREKHQDYVVNITCSFEGCGKQFRRENTYRAHYRMKHTDAKPVLKTYICEDCGRTFKNIATLKDHRFNHLPETEYPFQCEQCGKRFKSQRTYKEHLLRHAGIKNFECPFCGMRKTTRNELRTHINYHTKEKQWPCKHCPSVFNSSANLGLHDRVVHKGIRRYACRYCEQSFGKAETLKHHEMRHTGEKPHECQICGKRFIQVVALRAHLKTHNKVAHRKLSVKQQQLQQQLVLQQRQQQQSSTSADEVANACRSLVNDLNVV